MDKKKMKHISLTDHLSKQEADRKKAFDDANRKIQNKRPQEHKKPEHKPSKSYLRNMKLKKIGNTILKTIAGENKVGEWLHGVLDNSPFPNQMVAKFVSSKIHPENREQEKEKMLSTRNIVALAFSAMIIFLIVTGRVDDAIALSKALMGFV